MGHLFWFNIILLQTSGNWHEQISLAASALWWEILVPLPCWWGWLRTSGLLFFGLPGNTSGHWAGVEIKWYQLKKIGLVWGFFSFWQPWYLVSFVIKEQQRTLITSFSKDFWLKRDFELLVQWILPSNKSLNQTKQTPAYQFYPVRGSLQKGLLHVAKGSVHLLKQTYWHWVPAP